MFLSILKQEELNDLELEERAARSAVKRVMSRAMAHQKRRGRRHLRVHTVPSRPVAGQPCGVLGVIRRHRLSVVHVAVEMAPIAKVGGMGDVVTALGRAVMEDVHHGRSSSPQVDSITDKPVEVGVALVEGAGGPTTFLGALATGGHFCGWIYVGKKRRRKVRLLLWSCSGVFEALPAYGALGLAKCVFTIHNLSYGVDLVSKAMSSCQLATTVSPTYAQEISEAPAIAPYLSKLFGIRNGIDAETWDPESDLFLPMPYNAENAAEGKEAARWELPVRTLEQGGQFVLLGSAPDARVQGEFNTLRDQLARQYQGRASFIFKYDEPLSHLIYAASDVFVVPSIFEPCGLTQMIAMNYGSIPVVRRTGGLADTVFDVEHGTDQATLAGVQPSGFVFENPDSTSLDSALDRALAGWFKTRPGFRELQTKAMEADWSWASPALDYIELYYKALRS
eukprot:gene18937-25504_t